jgi:hypothetical protein
MEKSLGQIACEAAMRKIEQRQGIKMTYRCVKNNEIKPLPDTFEPTRVHYSTGIAFEKWCTLSGRA